MTQEAIDRMVTAYHDWAVDFGASLTRATSMWTEDEPSDGGLPVFAWERDPAFQWEFAKVKVRELIASQLTNWMRRIPIFGRLIHTFWWCLIAEGVRSTCKPRWGSITFGFLNDGMRPTLWHTWRSIVDPDEGIWVGRAPKNAADARRIQEG